VEIAKGAAWEVSNTKVEIAPGGVHDLVVVQTEDGNADLDWISFQ